MTYRQIALKIIEELEKIFGFREAKSIQRYLFTALEDRKDTEWLLIQDHESSSDFEKKVFSALPQLKAKMPVQYVVQKTWFYELPIVVTPAVLIPRPETEELVNKILHDHSGSHSLKIVDIGTGSGAIAISLAKNLKCSHVLGIDISNEAINIAKMNADLNEVEVDFLEYDILLHTKDNEEKMISNEVFDIIVSNPPYVKESEKAQMQENVLDYEPSIALFVTDEDPLIYYRSIINFAKLHLASGGYLYFEINENEGLNLLNLLKEEGFQEIELSQDINDKDRFIKAKNF